jgi:hypothetical protein
MTTPTDGSAPRPATTADYPLPLHQYDAKARVLDTVEYRSDGSVVLYQGNPGLFARLMGRPLVIKPATRSFVEVWGWTIAGAVISAGFVGMLWRQSRE